MKLAKLSLPKSKFGSIRASKLNSRHNSHQKSLKKSILQDHDFEIEPTTFIEKKTQNLKKKYQKTLKERNKMLRGQFSTSDPLERIYVARKDMLDRRIDRIEDEMRAIEQDQDQKK